MNPSTKKMLDDIGMSEEFRIKFGLVYIPMPRHSVTFEKDTVVNFSGQSLPHGLFSLAKPPVRTPVFYILGDLRFFDSIIDMVKMEQARSQTLYPKTIKRLEDFKKHSFLKHLEGYQAIDCYARDSDAILELARVCEENARIARGVLANDYTADDFKPGIASHGFQPISKDHEAWKTEFQNGINFTHMLNQSLDFIVPAGTKFEFIRGNSAHMAYDDLVIVEIGDKRKICTMNSANTPPGEKPLEFALLSDTPRLSVLTGFRDLLPFETPETLSYKQEPDTLQ